MDAETTTEDQEYGYTIDGEVYPEPESLTMEDHRIVKRYTGYDFRALAAMSEDVMYVDQDGIAAIMHISYRHRHPDMSFDEIQAVINRQILDEAQKTLQRPTNGAVPLDQKASTTKPDESSPSERSSSPSETDRNPSSSGATSPTSSESSDETPAATGTSGSEPSSQPSAQETTEA